MDIDSESNQVSSIASSPLNAKEALLFQGLVRQCRAFGPEVSEYIDCVTEHIQQAKPEKPLWKLVESWLPGGGNLEQKQRQTEESKHRVVAAGESFASFHPSGRDLDKFVLRRVVDEYVLKPSVLSYFLVFPRQKDNDPNVNVSEREKQAYPLTSAFGGHSDFTVSPVCLPAQQARIMTKNQSRYCMVFGRGARGQGRSVAQLNFMIASHRSKTFARLQHLKQIVNAAWHSSKYSSQLKKRTRMKAYDDDDDDESGDADGKKESLPSAKRLKMDQTLHVDSSEESDEKNSGDPLAGVTPPPPSLKAEATTAPMEIDHPVIKQRQAADMKYATATSIDLSVSCLFDYPIVLRAPRHVKDYVTPVPNWFTKPKPKPAKVKMEETKSNPIVVDVNDTMKFGLWTHIKTPKWK